MKVPLAAIGTTARLQELRELFDKLERTVNERFGDHYEIKAGDESQSDGEWSRQLKIRQGFKIGSSIELKADLENDKEGTVMVDESSKLENWLYAGILLPSVLFGIHATRQDIGFFAFFPGKKLGAILGGLLMVIPGAMLALAVKKIVMRSVEPKIEKLIEKVNQVCSTLTKSSPATEQDQKS